MGERVRLVIRCEGSGLPGNEVKPYVFTCLMCGRWVAVLVNGKTAGHDRLDVVAMIDRGDFDG